MRVLGFPAADVVHWRSRQPRTEQSGNCCECAAGHSTCTLPTPRLRERTANRMKTELSKTCQTRREAQRYAPGGSWKHSSCELADIC